MGKQSKTVTPSSFPKLDGVFFSKSLTNWYAIHERPLPWRELWRKHHDPWHIWVSEVMLQQTVIKSVVRVYMDFIHRFPDYRTLAQATPEVVKLSVRGLGYYRRFDALHRACRQLLTDNRPLPSTHDEWLDLPGVGAYTAAAIASITAAEPHGVVDGNVERVLCRFLDIRTQPNLPSLKRLFKSHMNEMCHMTQPGTLNQAVMELGQIICTPINPNCKICPVKTRCLAFKRSSQDLAPARKQQKKPTEVAVRLWIVASNRSVILVKRPDDAKFLAGTWGFPTEIQRGRNWAQDGTSPQIKTHHESKVGTFRHSITSHRIEAVVVNSKSAKFKKDIRTKLVDADDVEKNLISNLDRKAWTISQKNTKP